MIRIRFDHGLGDCSNLAHMLPLYARRGYQIEVACSPDKVPLFKAAGISSTNQPADPHGWPHAPHFSAASAASCWDASKPGWNLSRHPLPDIGRNADLWNEYLDVELNLDAQVPANTRVAVDKYLAALQQPVICIHTKGNTSRESKNLDDGETQKLYRTLLDGSDATLVLLDWDNRVPRLASHRVRHLTDDWRALNLLELYCLLERSALLIGIDSGPLHFVRFTNTPAVGLWTHHHPDEYLLPRARTLNITPAERRDLNKLRRVPYCIVECPRGGKLLDGEFIAEQALRMISSPRFLSKSQIARDVQLQQWVSWTRAQGGHLSDFVDRHRTFDLALRHLSRVDKPVVVETGCIRADEDWAGAGFSTFLLGAAMQGLRGTLHSVDLTRSSIEFARRSTACFEGAVQLHEAHSHEWLRQFAGPIDLLYSDSADVGTAGYEESCLMEIRTALPKLRGADSLILIDDTCWKRGQFHGKGATAVPWLLHNGWRLMYAGYQALLCRQSSARAA